MTNSLVSGKNEVRTIFRRIIDGTCHCSETQPTAENVLVLVHLGYPPGKHQYTFSNRRACFCYINMLISIMLEEP